jgi:pilus assembly protein CpaC
MKPSLAGLPALAALALSLAPCACTRHDARSQPGATATLAVATAADAVLPLPADLPPPAPPAQPDPPPSAEEVAAFHAPVPK